MAVTILDDVGVLGAVELGHGALRVFPPEVGVGRVDEDREGVGEQVDRVQDHVCGELQITSSISQQWSNRISHRKLNIKSCTGGCPSAMTLLRVTLPMH